MIEVPTWMATVYFVVLFISVCLGLGGAWVIAVWWHDRKPHPFEKMPVIPHEGHLLVMPSTPDPSSDVQIGGMPPARSAHGTSGRSPQLP